MTGPGAVQPERVLRILAVAMISFPAFSALPLMDDEMDRFSSFPRALRYAPARLLAVGALLPPERGPGMELADSPPSIPSPH